MKRRKPVLPLALSAILILNSSLPAFAADGMENAPSEKEEVIYIMLDTDGSVKNTYVVNSFEGGTITDYGNYTSVKMLNTSDAIAQNGDMVTFSSSAKKAYYQGDLENAEIPWDISLKYKLDGKEYFADELAGKSGHLELHFSITKNAGCQGSFYEDYALQAAFTLDTGKCSNISAPDATLANVGGDKQLTYTILPGEGIDTVISADVTDFEMDAVSINGIHLNLNVDVDDAELKDKVNQLIDATTELDDGAKELYDGSAELRDGSSELKDGASSLHSGITSLDEGVADLQKGLRTVQEGLDALKSQAASLTEGSSEFKKALTAIQTAVHSISVEEEALSKLTEASGQIRQALGQLDTGAATLQENLGYAQYKALMESGGLEIDALKEGNAEAISDLEAQIAALQETLDQIAGAPGMEEQAAKLQAQIAQLQQVTRLLEGNNAAINGTESYLNGIAGQLPALTEGLSGLKTQYEAFDTAVGQLVSTLETMAEKLPALDAGLNQLVESYEKLDGGIGAYTDGVAQLAAGYSQVMGGVSSLAEGSKELVSGSDELYDGTAELYDGVAALCDGAQEMTDGTDEFRRETADMDTQVEEKIDSLLDSIGGTMDEPASFVSEKNTNVDSVQFVIQTDAVEIHETEEAAAVEEEAPSFWEKLLRLFR